MRRFRDEGEEVENDRLWNCADEELSIDLSMMI
jgi:hypothetical protein